MSRPLLLSYPDDKITIDLDTWFLMSCYGNNLKYSGKTLNDLNKYDKYFYEQSIKQMKIMMKQNDMVCRYSMSPHGPPCYANKECKSSILSFHEQEYNIHNLMPELLDKIIDLGLDIGIVLAPPNHSQDAMQDVLSENGRSHSEPNKRIAHAKKHIQHRTDYAMFVDLAERIRDSNTEIMCLKEEFISEIEKNKNLQENSNIKFKDFHTKFLEEVLSLKEELISEVEQNKIQYDKNVTDINNILIILKDQEERINKQKEMMDIITTTIKTKQQNVNSKITYNRKLIVFMFIVYITFELYKIYYVKLHQYIHL